MTIKPDFATNSDSTPFILADCRIDKSKPIQVEIIINKDTIIKIPDLCKILPKNIISGKDLEDVIDMFKEEFKRYNINDINKIKIFRLTARNDSYSLQSLLYERGITNVNTKGVIILYGRGGY